MENSGTYHQEAGVFYVLLVLVLVGFLNDFKLETGMPNISTICLQFVVI